VSECEHSGRLGAYHDGELDAAGQAAVEQHLRRCASCAEELGRIRKLSELLGGISTPKPSVEVLHRLHETADLACARPLRRLAEALTAVAAAVLIACSAWLWRSPTAAGPAGQTALKETVRTMPTWETSAVQGPAEPSARNSEDQLALWMIQDLTRENRHDQN